MNVSDQYVRESRAPPGPFMSIAVGKGWLQKMQSLDISGPVSSQDKGPQLTRDGTTSSAIIFRLLQDLISVTMQCLSAIKAV